jgi:hypothetical protein
MAFTEFYCQTTGSNLNAGSTTNDNAVYTGVGDSNGTSVFTPSDGSTPASTVSVGDFASVYVTSGATVAVFIGRVTVVAAGVNGAITVSTTAKSGTFPASSAGAHTITCKVGGAWKGPNAAVGFPFNFIAATQTNVAGDVPRVNFKSGTNYAITAAMTHGVAGPVRFQGYTTNINDGGRATIDGGTSGSSYTLLSPSTADLEFVDLIFQNNGASAAANALAMTGTSGLFLRCVVNSIRGSGFGSSGASNIFVECEAYACNQSNSSNLGGFQITAAAQLLVRCISHDNTGSNSAGFFLQNVQTIISCIADTNGGKGFLFNAARGTMYFCDAYNNTSDGVDFNGGAEGFPIIENCNFVKNGGWGINSSGSSTARHGLVTNCGFGSGAQVNSSGQVATAGSVVTTGSVTYASGVTPWVDPANGDFRINLAAAKGAGRGAFTQTAASYAGTIAYPDIGASQHIDATIPTVASTFA